jgi:hypothetical protein
LRIAFAALVFALCYAPADAAHKRCPNGSHWVEGYTKGDGSKVAGYCRRTQ